MRYQSVINFSLIVILIFIFTTFLFSNESEDALFSREEETFHETELASFLNKLKNSPLDINKVSAKKLRKLPWLSNNDVELIIKYRGNKKIYNKKDLSQIGLNKITIERILPYISFEEKRIKYNWEEKFRASYKEKTKLKSSIKFYNSIKCSRNKFVVGFINQKDAGESNSLDFYSYYLLYNSPEANFSKVIFGKYRLFFGQGICFAPKLGMSKSSEATSTPLKRGSLINPYHSTFEMSDLEGGTFLYKFHNLVIIPFYSKTGIDANIKSDKITSFDYTGFHSNSRKKNSVVNTNFGTMINYSKKNMDTGILCNFEKFDHDFSDDEFKKENLYLSYKLNIEIKNYEFSSEIATANSKNAVIFVLKYYEKKYSNLLLFRNYEKYFPPWHGHPFAAQSSNFGNEKGIYYGFSYKPKKNVKFDLYTDLWNFPESRYLEKIPTFGSEIFGKLTLLKRNNLIDFTFQRKLREKQSTIENISKVRDNERNLYRINFIGKIGDLCNWKNRIEFVSEEIKDENKFKSGFLAYQQLTFKNRLSSFNFRITTTYGNVLHYVYENNVSGVMQNRICSGDNIFAFGLIKTKIKRFNLQLKVGGSLIDKSSLETYFFMKKIF